MKLKSHTLFHYATRGVLPVFLMGLAFAVAVPLLPVEAASPQQQACEGSGAKWEGGKCKDNTANGPTLSATITGAINILLFIIGVTAVIVIVVEALRFVNSNGDSQAVSKSKNGVIFALVGLVVATIAYAIVNFVLDQL
jgi:hypothetical protein